MGRRAAPKTTKRRKKDACRDVELDRPIGIRRESFLENEQNKANLIDLLSIVTPTTPKMSKIVVRNRLILYYLPMYRQHRVNHRPSSATPAATPGSTTPNVVRPCACPCSYNRKTISTRSSSYSFVLSSADSEQVS